MRASNVCWKQVTDGGPGDFYLAGTYILGRVHLSLVQQAREEQAPGVDSESSSPASSKWSLRTGRNYMNEQSQQTRKRERGQTTAEFVIVVPFLLLLFFLMVDFGWLFKNWLVVTNTGREVARRAVSNCRLNRCGSGPGYPG